MTVTALAWQSWDFGVKSTAIGGFRAGVCGEAAQHLNSKNRKCRKIEKFEKVIKRLAEGTPNPGATPEHFGGVLLELMTSFTVNQNCLTLQKREGPMDPFVKCKNRCPPFNERSEDYIHTVEFTRCCPIWGAWRLQLSVESTITGVQIQDLS